MKRAERRLSEPPGYSIFPVTRVEDVFDEYRGTPVADLLVYHNLGDSVAEHDGPQLVVATCIDARVRLRIPVNFAFVSRSPGADLRELEFAVSFAVGFGGARAVCLIGHSDCSMTGLGRRRDAFVRGLVERAGWKGARARQQFDEHVSRYEIADPAVSVIARARALGQRYPKLVVAPLIYSVEDGRLYQVDGGD